MNAISKHQVAILVFARSSQEEVKYKKISKGRRLFETLTQHTLQIVKDTNVPFFHFTEKLQDGLSFGERFSNAVQSVFDQGYERIITIGNDSPHLTKTHITTAITALDSSNLVLGPSADGGFYLMGLHRKDFERKAFENLSWQTSRVREEVLELLLPAEASCFLLPQLFDIDSFWDLIPITKFVSGISQQVLAAIRSVISTHKKIEIAITTLSNTFYHRIPSNRGSPTYSLS